VLPLLDARFCWYCWDGEATPQRARELIDRAAAGEGDGIRSLAALRDPRGIPQVSRALRDSNVRVLREAAAALADLGGPDAADALAGSLDDPAVRMDAAMALAWLCDERAFDALLALLYEGVSASRNVYRTPAVAFAWLEDRRAIPHLIAALGALADRWAEAAEPPWILRSAAEEIVRALLRFDDDDARRSAEEHAGSFGDPPLNLAVLAIAEGQPRRFTHPEREDPGRTVPKWCLELGPPRPSQSRSQSRSSAASRCGWVPPRGH
jgi:HEAT repeat protein